MPNLRHSGAKKAVEAFKTARIRQVPPTFADSAAQATRAQGIKKPSETCWNTVSDGLSNEKSNGVLFLLGTHAFQTATQRFIGVGHVFQTGELECQHGGVCRIGAAFGIEQIKRTGHTVFVAQIG